MIQFSTARILLQPFERTDQASLHQLFTDPFVRKYLWDDAIISEETVRDILMTNEHLLRTKQYGLWKVIERESGQLAGFIGFWHFFDESLPQLLYGLYEDWTGKGFATEAAQVVLEHAFQSLRFPYADAAMDKPHRASQAVAQRLGMRFLKEEVAEGKETVFYRLEAEAFFT